MAGAAVARGGAALVRGAGRRRGKRQVRRGGVAPSRQCSRQESDGGQHHGDGGEGLPVAGRQLLRGAGPPGSPPSPAVAATRAARACLKAW